MILKSLPGCAIFTCAFSMAAIMVAGCASTGEVRHEVEGAADTCCASPEEKSHLREMRINPRETRESQRLGSSSRRYVDAELVRDPTVAQADRHVSLNRLSPDKILVVLGTYRAAFKKPRLDPRTGLQMVDVETGEPLYEESDRDIRTSLAGALSRFRGVGRTGDLDPLEFRRYIESNREESVALGHVDAMQRFFEQLHLLGLGPKEEENCRRTNLGRVCPGGLRVQQLEKAIMAKPDDASLLVRQ